MKAMNHRSRRGTFNVFLLVAVLIFGTSCIQENSAPQENEPKIGAILPLTGNSATYGESCQRGMQTASEELGLSVIYEDGGAEARTAVNAFNKLTNTDDVDIVVGEMFSAPTLAFAPIAQEREILVLSPTSGSTEVPKTGNHIFSLYPAANSEGAYMGRYLEQKVENQEISVGVVDAQEQVYADIAKGFINALGDAPNIQVRFEESVPPNTREFREVIIKLKSRADTDAVFVSGSKEFVANFITQAKQLNYNADFYSQSTLYDTKLIDAYGEVLEGVTFTAPYFDTDGGSERVESFLSAFNLKFGEDPDVWAAYCYDTILTLNELINSCQNCDASAMSNTLQSLQIEGITGPVAFDNFGGAKRSFRIFEVTSGRFKVVSE